jgi:ankyrin repeat protein
VRSGQSIRFADWTGSTLLMTAADCGQAAVAEWLLDAGLPLDKTDDKGHSAVHSAVQYSHPAVLQLLLLARGADCTQRTSEGKSASDMTAAVTGVRCAELLLAAGASH